MNEATTAAEGAQAGGMNPFNMMALFSAVIAAVLFYCAITGKGPIYDVRNIAKDKQDEYKVFMRKMSWILAPLVTLTAACDYFRDQIGAIGPWLTYGSMIIVLGLVVFMAVKVVREYNVKTPKRK